MREIHLTKKDFEIEWFSGTGGGGQHRNKHANCCRIKYPPMNLRAQSTSHKERRANQEAAFRVLSARIIARLREENDGAAEGRRTAAPERAVRTYHGVRNDVVDHLSGEHDTYKNVVLGANLDRMIQSRRDAMIARSAAEAA